MRATLAISVVPLVGAVPAAAFGSGTIAFVDSSRSYAPLGQNLEIFIVQPDGSGLMNLTRSCEQESDPALRMPWRAAAASRCQSSLRMQRAAMSTPK